MWKLAEERTQAPSIVLEYDVKNERIFYNTCALIQYKNGILPVLEIPLWR